jgi:aldose 1-epimerase
MPITEIPAGFLRDGTAITSFELSHGDLSCHVLSYGGIITELVTPDRDGHRQSVALGLPTLQAYEAGHPYLGALTGRVAGRINDGKFELDGKAYALPLSQPPNHLHGGFTGLDKRVWATRAYENAEGEPCLELVYRSPAGEEGYPGTVDITVTYTLTVDTALRIDYHAVTDAPTPFSPTQHLYFNLEGESAGTTIADHEICVYAEHYIPADENGTLATELQSVAGTPHDFRTPSLLKHFIEGDDPQHGENYFFQPGKVQNPRRVATLHSPRSGRQMEVWTNESSMQLYTSKFLGESEVVGKYGQPYTNFGGICLECQGFPNAVNAPHLDDIILRPGTPYRQTTLYRFHTVP